MLDQYRRELIRDGTRYFWAYSILAVEPVVLIPLLVSLLHPEEIGVLGSIEALIVVLCGLSQLGVKFSYLQYVADYGQEDRGKGFWTALLMTCVAGFIAGSLAALLLDSSPVSGLLGMVPGVHWAVLGSLMLATNLQMMLVTDLRAKRTPLPFAASSLVRVIAVALFVLNFTLRMESPIEAILLAQLLGLGLSIAVLLVFGGMPKLAGFDTSLAHGFIGYGAPIALGSLVKYGTDAMLPWLCLALVSPVAAGAMALALKASSLFDTWFGWPFLMAWGGRVYHLAKEKTAATLSRRLFAEISLAVIVALLLSWLMSGMLLRATSGEESLVSEALVLLPLALVGRALFALRSPASVGQVAARNMGWHFRYAVAGLIAFSVLGTLAFIKAGVVAGWLTFLCIEGVILTVIYQRGQKMLEKFRREDEC
ncbi:MAG: hypothetical protein WC100_04710 [Sterolibacterium sp.]